MAVNSSCSPHNHDLMMMSALKSMLISSGPLNHMAVDATMCQTWQKNMHAESVTDERYHYHNRSHTESHYDRAYSSISSLMLSVLHDIVLFELLLEFDATLENPARCITHQVE